MFCVPVRRGSSFILIGRRLKTKKFYHRIPAAQPIAAIWQGIQPALRIRSRISKNPKRSRIRKAAKTLSQLPTDSSRTADVRTLVRRQGINWSDGNPAFAFPV